MMIGLVANSIVVKWHSPPRGVIRGALNPPAHSLSASQGPEATRKGISLRGLTKLMMPLHAPLPLTGP